MSDNQANIMSLFNCTCVISFALQHGLYPNLSYLTGVELNVRKWEEKTGININPSPPSTQMYTHITASKGSDDSLLIWEKAC